MSDVNLGLEPGNGLSLSGDARSGRSNTCVISGRKSSGNHGDMVLRLSSDTREEAYNHYSIGGAWIVLKAAEDVECTKYENQTTNSK